VVFLIGLVCGDAIGQARGSVAAELAQSRAPVATRAKMLTGSVAALIAHQAASFAARQGTPPIAM